MTSTPELLVRNCPLCGSQQNTVLDQRVLHEYQLINRLCANCGLVYLSPRLSEKQLVDFYARDYRKLYHGVAEPTPQDLAVQGQRARFLADFVRHGAAAQRSGMNIHPDKIQRHLDIGCSIGMLLQEFARQFGCASTGVELDDSHRAYAQKRGLTVYPERKQLPPGDPKYDLVSLIHVLEHLTDPLASLVDIRQDLLDQAGWLLLEVPNLYVHDSFEIAHLFSFSQHTLVQIVKQAGFEVVAVQAHGQPRSRLLRLYVTLLARPAPKASLTRPSIRPEKQVAFKRKTGIGVRRFIERLLPSQAWLPVEKN